VLLVFILAIYLFHFRKENTLSLSEAVKIVKPALTAVRVFQEKPGTPFMEVNGFFYGNKDQVVMCASLLRDASFIEVKAFDGRVYSPKFVVSEDRPSGLVKLQLDLPAKQVSIVSITETMPRVNDRVFLVDSKSSSSESIIQTDLSQITEVPGVGPVFRLGMPISERMAGCPVFNFHGKMIGVATALYEDGGYTTFVLPQRSLDRLDLITENTMVADWLATNLRQARAQRPSEVNEEGGIKSGKPSEVRDANSEGSTSGSGRDDLSGKEIVTASMSKAIPSDVVDRVNKATVMVKTPISIGSGFFVTNTGYILTNRHVIDKSETLVPDFEKNLQKGHSYLDKGTDLMRQMKKQLAEYEQSLEQQGQELNHLRNWLRDTERRIASGGSFPALEESFESRRLEYNRKVQIYNRLLEQHKQLRMDFERVKNQVGSLQEKVTKKEEEYSKVLYEPLFKVMLSDGSEHRAYKVAMSTKYDVGLLKIDGLKTPCVEVGDPQRIQKGCTVFAIGSPLGLSNSVTSGVFSAHREDMLQTSAPINIGNSGGPLLTEDGKVIGINTQKMVGPGVEGISFAIPIDVALKEMGVYIRD